MHGSDGQGPRGEVRALAAELYRERRPFLLAVARRHTDAGIDAEAALQDAFLAFLEHYDPGVDGSRPLPWLTLTLKRRCWNAHRRCRAARERIECMAREETTTTVPPVDPLEALERAERTRTGLARLKPAERRALSLLALGYSYREICRTTGWTYTKVNRSIRDGRKALRAGAGNVAA
jgi:RNA polymerase sigma factor (sigma-70 family)